MADESQSPPTSGAPELNDNDLQVTPLGNGRYRIDQGTSRSLAYAVVISNAAWVYLNGRVYVVDETIQRGVTRSSRDDERALSAPMPATVASINVETGQQIAEGDVLMMLEAMKMELPITAPRAARVKAIYCRPGDLVQPGVMLVELE